MPNGSDTCAVYLCGPNDLAFPWDENQGLTKREYFATMAMQGLAARPDLAYELIPREAIEMADALIEALNKQ